MTRSPSCRRCSADGWWGNELSPEGESPFDVSGVRPRLRHSGDKGTKRRNAPWRPPFACYHGTDTVALQQGGCATAEAKGQAGKEAMIPGKEDTGEKSHCRLVHRASRQWKKDSTAHNRRGAPIASVLPIVPGFLIASEVRPIKPTLAKERNLPVMRCVYKSIEGGHRHSSRSGTQHD